MQSFLLLIDAALVLGLGAWMVVAVADNWRHPTLNEDAVAMVVRLDAMAEEYPEEFKQVAYRRIEDPRIIRRLFHLIRAAETLAAVLLIASAALLAVAALAPGMVGPAQVLAVGSTAFFICIWAGFIIGGNYFAYWYCHQWAQSNHFMFMYWGFFVLLILLL